MIKSSAPVISTILLILITIVATASAYFFINSNVLELESKGSAENFPGTDNSRINIVSITGNKMIVRNDGTSQVTDLVVIINGELLNYALNEPILPGELREINYTAMEAGKDLEITVIYNRGKTAGAVSPARLNTESSGFFDSSSPGWYSECSFGSVIADLSGALPLSLSHNFSCTCSNIVEPLLVNNSGFIGTAGWSLGGNANIGVDPLTENPCLKLLNNTGDDYGYANQLFGNAISSVNLSYYINEGIPGTHAYADIDVYFTLNDENIVYLYYYFDSRGTDLSWCDGGVADDYWKICLESPAVFGEWASLNIDGIVQDFEIYFPSYSITDVVSAELSLYADSDYSNYYVFYDNLSVNGSINLNNNYCDNNNDGSVYGVCFNQECLSFASSQDLSINSCSYYSNEWVLGTITGLGMPCCQAGDTFTNSTHSCCSGIFRAGSC